MIFLPTIKQFLSKSLIPMGHTMYIYGGGWNREDSGAGHEARIIGEPPGWKAFYRTQGSCYNFRNFSNCNSLGLDCTGYIGWVLYNLFSSENDGEGYVFKSDSFGLNLNKKGLGAVTRASEVTNFRCGDIFYSGTEHHAYICFGECIDGSVILAHSSPPGVMLSGTPARKGGGRSIAQYASETFMQKNFNEWYNKFPDTDRGEDYLTKYDRFRFYKVVVSDPEGLTKLYADEVLSIFEQNKINK